VRKWRFETGKGKRKTENALMSKLGSIPLVTLSCLTEEQGSQSIFIHFFILSISGRGLPGEVKFLTPLGTLHIAEQVPMVWVG
jgi:hypothetical protein